MRRSAPRLLALLLAVRAVPVFAATQEPIPAFAAGIEESGWNSTRVRDLMRRAIERRASWSREGAPSDYRAHARGHIYFLYDLGRGSERHLVKADQLALELYWQSPDQTRQVIVGRREEKALPTGIRYHLDHLTVVMDNLGDRIRLGEGSEVEDALHPAARGALAFYEYRLADSLTLVMPQREVRVYEVAVRPRDPRGPGLVGSLYLDRATADIVRMDFTFTAASYLDETLDYFNIRLENALWEGRYWLPYRQGIELRREIEAVQFPAGGIIRAEFRISDYRFNTGLPDGFFRGARIASLPEPQLGSFEFDAGLHDALDPEVAVTPPSMEEIRERASRIVRDAYLKRAEGLRLAVPGASSVVRFRRAEGLYAGPGLARRLGDGTEVTLTGGYAVGADRVELEGRVAIPSVGPFGGELTGYYRKVVDASPWPRSSGAVATLAALIDGEDYREPYWATGGAFGVERRWETLRAKGWLAWESWDTAELAAADVVSRRYRPVRELDAGDVLWWAFQVGSPPVVAVEAVGGLSWSARLEGASRELAGDFTYLRGFVRGEALWPDAGAGWGLRVSGSAAAAGGGRLPAQRLIPAGGRGTVSGYGFDRFVGNLYGDVELEVHREVRSPFLSLSAFVEAGWVGIEGDGAREAVAVWNRRGRAAGSSRGPLLSAGAGLGLLFDIVRVEVSRGLRQGGIWELVVRTRAEFWPWL